MSNESLSRDIHNHFLTFTCDEASLGNPLHSIPISVVVPPISITIASFFPERNMAPLILLVGPEEKVKMGCFIASSTLL